MRYPRSTALFSQPSDALCNDEVCDEVSRYTDLFLFFFTFTTTRIFQNVNLFLENYDSKIVLEIKTEYKTAL